MGHLNAAYSFSHVQCLPGWYETRKKEEAADYYQRKMDGIIRPYEIAYLCGKKDISSPCRWHEFHEIYLSISGECRYMVEGKIFSLAPNDIVVVPAGCIHRPTMEDSPTSQKRVILWIRTNYLETLSSQQCQLTACFKQAEKGHCFFLPHTVHESTPILYCLHQLLMAQGKEAFGNDLLCEGLIRQILVHLNRILLEEDPSATVKLEEHPLVNRSISFIAEHLAEPISLDTIADSLFVSKYHLAHIFKKYTGTSIHQYIIYKRLALAKTLIAEGQPISTLHLSCGFHNYSNFFKAFKGNYGITPKQYHQYLQDQI